MTFIIIVLVLVCLCISGIVVEHCSRWDFLEPLAVVSFLVLLVLTVCFASSYTTHADNLGTIRTQHEVISVYEKNVAELSEFLPKLKMPSTQFINADTPLASLILSLYQSNDLLVEAKASVAKAKVAIAQRKAGLFSIVVTIMGEE